MPETRKRRKAERNCAPPASSFYGSSAGNVPKISGELSTADHLGAFMVRWGINRMNYRVAPGLYALNSPEPDSPVLVTANYKVSFDRLRSAYDGRNAWILVLDTRGINVWCAAGKGSFGTEELINRLQSSGLAGIINHRTLILPQLAAPGVSAHEVKRATGFRVVYGPVKAADLPRFMDNGMKASGDMRLKGFPLFERLALIPMEFLPALKRLVVILPVFLIMGGLGFDRGFAGNVAVHGGLAALVLGGGLLAGTVLTPLLLPWLPGRAFAVKGGFAGVLTQAILLIVFPPETATLSVLLERAGLLILGVALSSYLGLNFTGSSTYTSLSGVKKEMRRSVPVLFFLTGAGLLSWLAAGFMI